MLSLLDGGVGWLLFTSLVLCTGTIVGRWLILPRTTAHGTPSSDWMDGEAARLGLWASLLLPVALSAFLVRQFLEFRDPFAPWQEDARLLLEGTSWGSTWLLGFAGSLVLCAALLLAKKGVRVGWWVATPVVALLSVFPALTGHAGGEEELRFLAISADVLHVWAAGAWMGGLGFVLFIESRWRRSRLEGDPHSLLPQLVPIFSPIAMVSVGILAGTGLFASWLHLPSVSALWTSDYGRLLSLKLLLVGMVLGLGALNWKRLGPKLGQPSANDALRRAASTELLIAQLVLFVTAVLVRTSQVGH